MASRAISVATILVIAAQRVAADVTVAPEVPNVAVTPPPAVTQHAVTQHAVADVAITHLSPAAQYVVPDVAVTPSPPATQHTVPDAATTPLEPAAQYAVPDVAVITPPPATQYVVPDVAAATPFAPTAQSAAQAAVPAYLMSADKALTVQELQEWRSYQLDKLGNVPSMFRSYAVGPIEKDFQTHLVRLTNHSSAELDLDLSPPKWEIEEAARAKEAARKQAEEKVRWEAEAKARWEAEEAARKQRANRDAEQAARKEKAMKEAESSASKDTHPTDCAAIVAPGNTQHGSVEIPLLFMTASMCLAKQDLNVWMDCQINELENHVPPSHRSFARRHLFNQLNNRIDELSGKSGSRPHLSDADALPVFLSVAKDCASEDELVAWKSFQQGQIERRVPPKFHDFSSGALQGAFQQRLAELRIAGGGKYGKGTMEDYEASRRPSVPAVRAFQTSRPEGFTTSSLGERKPVRSQNKAPTLEIGAAAAQAAANFPDAAATSAGRASTSMSALFMLLIGGLVAPALLSFVASLMKASTTSSTWKPCRGGLNPFDDERHNEFQELF